MVGLESRTQGPVFLHGVPDAVHLLSLLCSLRMSEELSQKMVSSQGTTVQLALYRRRKGESDSFYSCLLLSCHLSNRFVLLLKT